MTTLLMSNGEPGCPTSWAVGRFPLAARRVLPASTRARLGFRYDVTDHPSLVSAIAPSSLNPVDIRTGVRLT
ncbi:hypothetical protein [Actinoalloteichus spitiensis]|uniref:hypothetical protein n=1 Tax=Actinoalloteichus spitiensis TaxID=252394 RepID=UPI0002EDB9D0|nr:hypothetical protein [Actinoalloteichus spitiensis]